jgi:hypothetical protein
MRDLRRINEEQAKKESDSARRQVEQLRDEIRLRIHLGGMELRDAFQTLEREADHFVSKVEPKTTRAINEVAVGLRRIAHALDGKQ